MESAVVFRALANERRFRILEKRIRQGTFYKRDEGRVGAVKKALQASI
jgi:hypothetical protein